MLTTKSAIVMDKHWFLRRVRTVPFVCILCGLLCPFPVSLIWRQIWPHINLPPEAGALFNFIIIALGSSIVSGSLCRLLLSSRLTAVGTVLANSSGWYSLIYILLYVRMQSSVSIMPLFVICLSTSFAGLPIVWLICNAFKGDRGGRSSQKTSQGTSSGDSIHNS